MPFGAQLFFFLLAGASANYPSARGGALTFSVNGDPFAPWWPDGSAFIYIMLLVGACADVTSSHGGAFALHESSPSSDTWWTDGSASNSLLVEVLLRLH